MDSEKFELMKADERAVALQNEDSIFLNVARFEQMQRVSAMLAKSDFVPDRFKGSIGNCMIALDMASLMGMNPIMLMRCMYVVNGQPGFEAKFISALINNSARFAEPIDYEWKGQKGQAIWGCRAFGTLKKTGKNIYGPWVDWEMVRANRWDQPKGQGPKQQVSKWVTMPEVMFLYRAVTLFGRTHCSDLLMGMKTVDELQDIQHDLVQAPDGSYQTIDATPDRPKGPDLYQVTGKPPETQQQENPPEKQASEAAPVPPDEYGTPLNNPFAKDNWYHAKGGNPEKGTGLHGYIAEHAESLKETTEKTFFHLSEKYMNLYKKPIPWDHMGVFHDDSDPENHENMQPQQLTKLPKDDPEQPQQQDLPYYETDAFRLLGEKAKTNKREYLMVVRGKKPESLQQIMQWLDEINELIVEHAKNSQGADDDDQGWTETV